MESHAPDTHAAHDVHVTLEGSPAGSHGVLHPPAHTHDASPAASPAAPEQASLTATRRALALNRAIQQRLHAQLQRIEHAQARNTELQRRFKELATQAARPAARRETMGLARKFLGPYFVDVRGETPPDNDDAREKKALAAHAPAVHRSRKWTDAERAALAKGVRQKNQELLMRPLQDDARAGLSGAELARRLDAIRNMPSRDLEMNVRGIDWERLARTHLPGRSGVDCRLQWLNNDHPLINNGPWTRAEDRAIVRLAHERGELQWEAIAEAVGTNRTAAQCLSRYQRALNPGMLRSKWTPEEDAALAAAVRRHGEGNWQQVASDLEGRTGQQCLHRWQKTLDPGIRRGKWTEEEDGALRRAVDRFGVGNWFKVQTLVPGRTDVQCRERWVNVLDPALCHQPWSREEDARLLEAVAQYGTGRWSRIAQELPPRTDNQCWRRYKSLMPIEAAAGHRLVLSAVGGPPNRRKRTLDEIAPHMGAPSDKRPREDGGAHLPLVPAAQSLVASIPRPPVPPQPSGARPVFSATAVETDAGAATAMFEEMFRANAHPEAPLVGIPPLPPLAATVSAHAALQLLLGDARAPEAAPPPQVDPRALALLQTRFRALFVWPSMLAAADLQAPTDDAPS